MIVNFGYVAMSMSLENASPSQTMTASQFSKLKNREDGLKKLERIAISNLENCLRLLKHNAAHDITFFRLSSKLVPLVNHPYTEGWKYEKALTKPLKELGEYATKHKMRIDFHPDHFVVLNSEKEILKNSLQTLFYHYKLLTGMNLDATHRCVLHVGGKKHGKETGLETFIENFSSIPKAIAKMLMLENDDKVYTLEDVLYLGEKLAIPVVVDLHHHDLNHGTSSFLELWERVIATWKESPFPIKIHLSSPLNGEEDRRHHDYIQKERFLTFLEEINGSCETIDVMIEAKKKDLALFKLIADLKKEPNIEVLSGAKIRYKGHK